MHPFLEQVFRDWLNPDTHPGGQFTLCHDDGKPFTVNTAHYHLKKALKNSKWSVIQGFHVFRHSFASILASNGVDQRIINEFVGHDTVQMERRYRHLIKDKTQLAIRSLFV
jgi:site-specific recombinase XerD